jgi:hypothetical protein
MKYAMGLSVIVVIVVLLVGPMFLFSTYNFLGELNPVSKCQVDFELEVVNSDSQSSSFKIFSTSTILKKNDTISTWAYDLMGFHSNAASKGYAEE